MIINLETLEDCKAVLRAEVPPDVVKNERRAVVGKFTGKVRIPGYRPGKVPVTIVENRFRKDIESELRRTLRTRVLEEAAEQKKLSILSVTDVKDELGLDDSFNVVAQLVLAPDFELPDYESIPIQIPKVAIGDEDVDASIERLRKQQAKYHDAEAGKKLEMGDYAVVNFSGSCEDRPLVELLPAQASYYASREDAWIHMDDSSFLPGFCAELLDHSVGDTVRFSLTLPDDFAHEELQGKEVDYEVTLEGVKLEDLPDIDDDFVRGAGGEGSLEEFRGAIRSQLESKLSERVEAYKTDQIVGYLNRHLDFDLPEGIVNSETQHRVNEIVTENMQRGISDDSIMEHQNEILGSASDQAKVNVKTNFILGQIADEENITVDETEIMTQIEMMAARAGCSIRKMASQVKKDNRIRSLAHQIRLGKTLDFLRSNASVTEVEDFGTPGPGAVSQD